MAALARHKADSAPDILKVTVRHACMSRWFAILAVAVQQAIANSVLTDEGYDLATQAPSVLGGPPLIDILDLNR